jgi:hypothetical protein
VGVSGYDNGRVWVMVALGIGIVLERGEAGGPRLKEWHPFKITRLSDSEWRLTTPAMVDARTVSILPPRVKAREPWPPTVASAWPQKIQACRPRRKSSSAFAWRPGSNRTGHAREA